MAARLPRRRGDHSSGAPVTRRLAATYPDDWPENRLEGPKARPRHPYSVLLPMGFTVPLPLLASAVGSYPTFSPLPHGKPGGGLFSVALSLGLAGKPVSPAGSYPASCFHGARTFLCCSLSAHLADLQQRSPDRLAGGHKDDCPRSSTTASTGASNPCLKPICNTPDFRHGSGHARANVCSWAYP